MLYEQIDKQNTQKYRSFAKAEKILHQKGYIEDYNPGFHAFAVKQIILEHNNSSISELVDVLTEVSDSLGGGEPHVSQPYASDDGVYVYISLLTDDEITIGVHKKLSPEEIIEYINEVKSEKIINE